MKRWLSIGVVMIMLLMLLSGCGKSSGSNDDSVKDTVPDVGGPVEAESPEADSVWSGDVSHIIMTYLTLGTTPADLQKVQDAVNEISVARIGVEVEFKPVSVYDAMTQFPLWIGTGEQIDLMMPLMQPLQTYVNQGLIEPLDDWLAEYAPNILRLAEDGLPVTSPNIIDGETYAVLTVAEMYGLGGAYMVDHQYVADTDFDFNPDKIYSVL